MLQFLSGSQITHDLGGSLAYNHDSWVETQRVREGGEEGREEGGERAEGEGREIRREGRRRGGERWREGGK